MDLPLSYIELSKSNLVNNIKQLKKVAKKGTEFSVAIKGNAYGHGQNEIVKILEPHVDYFQVDSIEELRLLRKISKKKTFVFGYVQKSDIKEIMKLECILSIFSIDQMLKISSVAKSFKKVQEVHIPVDAYLGREGFQLSELENLFTEIKKNKYIKVTGMYAHFANIEDTNDFSHAYKQIKCYEKALKLANDFNFSDIKTHMSATSGLLVYEKAKGINNIIRLGIGVYGLWPSEHIKSTYKSTLELKPVLSLKTKVAQIKSLKKGDSVGYGLTYVAKNDTKIALIPLGYADGFDRGFSNNGEVLIGGTKCKILGRVMMNMFVVDVSHLKNILNEDEVVIIGKQGYLQISVEDLATHINTINYEITTRISPLLPKVVV